MNRPAILARFFAALLAGSVACTVDGSAENEARAPGNPGGEEPALSARFVGRASCEGCHADEATAWSGSHHDLAMQEASDRTVLGDFGDASLSYFGETYEFFRRGSAFWVRFLDADGSSREHEIAYAFGVDPLQQYLVRFPGGRLQALSVAWDARPAEQGGQTWFHLYPNERIDSDDPLHWTSLAQTWNYMCGECHSTDLRKGYIPEEDRYETAWAELDVSCEACHGPGSEHVARAEEWAANADADGAPVAAHLEAAELGLAVDFSSGRSEWAFEPGASVASRTEPRLKADVQVEACGRCHSRRAVISSSYEYGRLLADTHLPALLDEGLYYADGQIDDEVYVYGSFLQSRMYRAGVTCTDCHDAHSLALRAPGNALCGRCHLPSVYDSASHHRHDVPAIECVECHMPTKTYMVVDPRRDHSFRVPRPELSAEIGVPNACSSCHVDRPLEWAMDAMADWYAGDSADTEAEKPVEPPHYGVALAAGREGRPAGEAMLIHLADDASAPAIVRATAISLLGRYGSPGTIAAASRALGDPDPLVRTAAVRAMEALRPEARIAPVAPLLDDAVGAVRQEAARVLSPAAGPALSPAQSVSLERATREYMEAQLANADHPSSHVNLALLAASRGDLSEAERELRTAMEIGPYFVPAYVNLADLYRTQGREEDGEEVLRKGIAELPAEAALHHALGLAYARRQRGTEALASLGEASRLAPDDRRFAFVYAVALNSAGRSSEAIDVLSDALDRAPWDRDLLVGLATFHRDRGELRQALEYARQLFEAWPEDEAARQLVAELESTRG